MNESCEPETFVRAVKWYLCHKQTPPVQCISLKLFIQNINKVLFTLNDLVGLDE